MKWEDVGQFIGQTAPLVAGLLGGPAAGTVASLIAGALGCDATPDAVYHAIQADPGATEKLGRLQAEHARDMAALALQARQNELAAETARLAEVNATMRAEAQSERWWVSAWWPFWGFVSAVAFGVVAVFVCILGYRATIGGHAETLRMIPDLVSATAVLFAIPGGILGIASWHRGMEKRERTKS